MIKNQHDEMLPNMFENSDERKPLNCFSGLLTVTTS